MSDKAPTQKENSLAFDRELSERRWAVRRDNEFVQERLAQLRAAGVGPAAGIAAGAAVAAAAGGPAAAVASVATDLAAQAATAAVQTRAGAAEPSNAQATASDATPAMTEQQEIEAKRRALDTVMKRYRKVGDTFHLKDAENTPAFKDKGEKLTTKTNDPDIARSMVDLARAKGWDFIKVTGTNEFKREVWMYASAQGLEVGGYQPSELDKLALAELKQDVMKTVASSRSAPARAPAANDPVRQAAAPAVPAGAASAARPAAPADSAQEQTTVTPAVSDVAPALTKRHEAALAAMETVLRRPSAEYPQGHSQAQIDAALGLARKQWTTDRVYVGQVEEHGPAKYDFNPDGSDSYYVKLTDPRGAKFVLWGLNLPRALEDAKAQPGEDLIVAYKGVQKVTVPVSINVEGGGKRVEYQEAERNIWDVSPVRKLMPEKAQEAKLKAAKSAGPSIKAIESIKLGQPVQVAQPQPQLQRAIPARSRGR